MRNNNSIPKKILEYYIKLEEKKDEYARDILKQEINKRIYQLSKCHELYNKKESFKNASLLSPIITEVEKSITDLKLLSKGLEEPFLLFIVGMGNYGKSTLLNALLEEKMAEIDALPKTWKIDIFYGKNKDEKNLVEIRYNNGNKKYMNIKKAKKYLKKEEAKREQSELKVYEEFEEKKKECESVKEKEELKEALEKHHLYKSPVNEVRWPVKENNLLNDFSLVDTPGLVQNLLGEVKMNISEYYHKADGVIWLLDATKISAEKAREMLDDLNDALEEIGGKTDNIIAALNRIDIIRKNGGKQAVKKVKAKAEDIFGDIFDKIIPISAKEAMEGVLNNNDKLVQKSGLNNLKNEIKNNFYYRAKEIQINSKREGFNRITFDLNKKILNYKKRLHNDNKRRYNVRGKFKKGLDNIEEDLKEQINSVIESYKNDVRYNIDNETEQLFDIEEEKEQESFVKNILFEKESFMNELEKLKEQINETLYDFSIYHKKKSIFKEFTHLKQEINLKGDKKDINLDEVDYSYDDNTLSIGVGVTFAASIIFGPIGFILGGLASYFGVAKWISLQFKLPKVKKKLREQLEKSTKEIKLKLNKQLEENLNNIKKEVKKVRKDSFKIIHGDTNDIKKSVQNLENMNKILTKELPTINAQNIILYDHKKWRYEYEV